MTAMRSVNNTRSAGRMLVAAAGCLLGLLSPTASWAQPDLWSVSDPLRVPAVQVVDATTGALRHQFTASSHVCIGSAVMTPDGRSYLVSTNAGIARFDVPTARLVEVRPITGGYDTIYCPEVYVSSTGRWWYAKGYMDIIPSSVVVDPLTGAIVGGTHERFTKIAFGEGEWRYQRGEWQGSGETIVSAWPTPDSIAPAWQLPPAFNIDIEATPSSVYVLSVRTPDSATADIARYEPQTGTELARALFPRTSDVNLGPTDLEVVGNRVVLSGHDDSMGGGTQQFLAAFDADTLAPGPVVYHDAAGSDRLFVDSAGVLRFGSPGYGRPEHWFVVDPDTLALTHSWGGRGGTIGTAFGVASPPGAPALTVSATTDRRLTLSWVPDAHGHDPWTFQVRGALAGQTPASVVQVPGDQFTWTSPPLPPGSYEVEVAAANAVGPGAASNRVAISVGEASVPTAPRDVTADIVDDVLRLTWLPPDGGALPEGYVVEGAAAGSQAFAALTRLSATEFRLAGVPAGNWQARVRAFTAGGEGPASEPVAVTAAACGAAPGAPSGLAFVVSGQTVTLQWTPPATGSAAEYVLEAGSSPGQADLVSVGTGGPAPVFQSPVPAGAYYVRVRARNACGDSPASNEVVIVVL